MAWTTTDRDAIKAAILALATGARTATVAFGDRTVSYQPAQLPELTKLLNVIEAELASTTRPKQFHAYYNGKGLTR